MSSPVTKIPLADLPPLPQQRLAELCADAKILQLQQALGVDSKLHVVGGSLRNIFLGQIPGDLDLSSALDPSETTTRLERAGIHTIPTGLKHQTVTAVLSSDSTSENVEITAFRGPEMSPAGGVVLSNSIEIDLLYRDFTINALAFDLERQLLIDATGSRTDIEQRIVRTVGDPEQRFSEDPLRALRLVRFCCLPGFTPDPESLKTAASFAEKLAQVSPERIRDELNKILVSSRAREGFCLLQQLGFLKLILPELETCYGFEQNEFHCKDVFHHTLDVLENTEPDLLLRLAALFHDIGKPPSLSVESSGQRHFYCHETIGAEMTAGILDRLRYPNGLNERVVSLVRTHMRPISAGPGGIRRLIRDTAEDFATWRKLKEADSRAVLLDPQELTQALAEFDQLVEKIQAEPDVSPLKNLALNGEDLIALGLKPGPIFGRILRALHELVLDTPELNDKQLLLKEIEERNLVLELADE